MRAAATLALLCVSAAGGRWWRRSFRSVPADDEDGDAAAAAHGASLQPALRERQASSRAAQPAHDANRPDGSKSSVALAALQLTQVNHVLVDGIYRTWYLSQLVSMVLNKCR